MRKKRRKKEEKMVYESISCELHYTVDTAVISVVEHLLHEFFNSVALAVWTG